VPFFIGVARQSPATMTIYSAEILPYLFSWFGIPDKLSLRLVDQSGRWPTQARFWLEWGSSRVTDMLRSTTKLSSCHGD
jgi:hypothetical protein